MAKTKSTNTGQLIFDINFPFLLLTEAEPINKYMLVGKRFYILCLTICPTKIHFK